ncbi:MAG: Cro/C1-type DNA-binding domain [Blastocatellia bacterium]
MVRLIVKETAENAGIKSAYELAQRTGIPVRSVYRIWNGEATMLGLDTIDALCYTLEVPIAQLLRYERTPRKPKKGKKEA